MYFEKVIFDCEEHKRVKGMVKNEKFAIIYSPSSEPVQVSFFFGRQIEMLGRMFSCSIPHNGSECRPRFLMNIVNITHTKLQKTWNVVYKWYEWSSEWVSCYYSFVAAFNMQKKEHDGHIYISLYGRKPLRHSAMQKPLYYYNRRQI